MFTSFRTLTLLAANERMQQTMKALRALKNDEILNREWMWLMISLAIFTVAVLITGVVRWYLKRRKMISPQGLFSELCRAHGLKWSEQRLLLRLASSRNLHDPACMFLMPECFEIDRLTVELRPCAEELRRISERIFAGSFKETRSQQNGNDTNSREGRKTNIAAPLSPLPPTLILPQWSADEMRMTE